MGGGPSGISDEEAALKIRDDEIHVLYDLSGHTEFNRLGVFSLRPAPVQVTWLGYFGTTGMREIDYIMGDPIVTPVSEEKQFVEKVIRLPETYLCFSPPDTKSATSELPAIKNGFVTFGCFNSLIKINDKVVRVWAKILHAVPKSKLFLKTKLLGFNPKSEELIRRFEELGIDRKKLILEGWSPRDKLLQTYNEIDIVLDPFPYPGGTTSAESLWMGVPVITLKGNNFLSHVGETVVKNTGLDEWIAEDEHDYIEKAFKFASDLRSLGILRSQPSGSTA